MVPSCFSFSTLLGKRMAGAALGIRSSASGGQNRRPGRVRGQSSPNRNQIWVCLVLRAGLMGNQKKELPFWRIPQKRVTPIRGPFLLGVPLEHLILTEPCCCSELRLFGAVTGGEKKHSSHDLPIGTLFYIGSNRKV